MGRQELFGCIPQGLDKDGIAEISGQAQFKFSLRIGIGAVLGARDAKGYEGQGFFGVFVYDFAADSDCLGIAQVNREQGQDK